MGQFLLDVVEEVTLVAHTGWPEGRARVAKQPTAGDEGGERPRRAGSEAADRHDAEHADGLDGVSKGRTPRRAIVVVRDRSRRPSG